MRKKTGGEKMPVHMIGDILAAELSHMQAYIRFCSCQLNGAALIQQKTDEAPDFKEFVKVRSPGSAEPLPPQGAICRQLVCNRTCTEGQQGRGLSCTGGGAGPHRWV